ncbi:MAG TPA: BON domain-containing protein [Polyangia bacterium]|nr:BON domain-containing protein [Polyangia bacterium]
METQLATRASLFLEGLAVGAGLMYTLDPARGRRRRGKLRDQVARGVHEVEERADVAARDLGHRARGLWFDLRSVFAREQADDDVLAERAHARLGHLMAHPRTVELAVHDGRVTLRGKAPAADVERLLAALRAVRGVHDVENQLQPTDEPSRAFAPRLPFKWSPGARLLTALAAGMTIAYAARRLG